MDYSACTDEELRTLLSTSSEIAGVIEEILKRFKIQGELYTEEDLEYENQKSYDAGRDDGRGVERL
jgi:intein/homing endonuclease